MSIDLTKMPKIGFGLMRLPETDGKIDIEKVCRMVDSYMDAGFTYFDTAYVYHGGNSEKAVKEAIVKRYPRDSFTLATKLPAWCIHSYEDRDKIFNEQLERCGVDYFDFYLLHSIEDGNNYNNYVKYDCFNWGIQKKAEGKIKHFGFSYHGTPELLIKIVDSHPEIEFVQIQLNYADWDNKIVHSGELYQILAERNIPIIVMEPCKGGKLANHDEECEAILKNVRPDKSVASWAFRYVGSLPGVTTILSGMSTQDQLEDNMNTFKNFEPLSDEEKEAIEKVKEVMFRVELVGCTACRYCVDGCPMHIAIPDVISAVNTKRKFPGDVRPNFFYGGLVERDGNGKASMCIGCGQCEGVCPQHLPIIEIMKEAVEKFESKT
ncbi:MAG: 4Fe-4S dicluster domain-containing protein [Ruminococcaceae bacterium]|nr:4Fe-4S dicluster domain-containing protein [Oscillospiraceae bacterium]